MCLRHLVVIADRSWLDSGDAFSDSVSHLDLPGKPLSVAAADRAQRAAGQAGNVPGQYVVGVGWIKIVSLDQVGAVMLELVCELVGDEVLVNAARQLCHPGEGRPSGKDLAQGHVWMPVVRSAEALAVRVSAEGTMYSREGPDAAGEVGFWCSW